MGEIDWNSELKKIVREYDGLPPEPTPAERRAFLAAEQRKKEQRGRRTGTLQVTTRLGLALVLSTALLFWPYSSRCGLPLAGYLGAVGALGVAGLWAAAGSWSYRMARSHTLAMLVVIWSLVLAGMQALPRVGYALPDVEHPAGWRCG
jgi:hypothetical protein